MGAGRSTGGALESKKGLEDNEGEVQLRFVKCRAYPWLGVRYAKVLGTWPPRYGTPYRLEK